MAKDEEFGVLRAKASAKIVRLAERHRKNLKKYAKKLGIKASV